MGTPWALPCSKYFFKSSPARWISDRPELARAIARTSSAELGSGRRNSSSRKTSTRFESRRLGVIGSPKASTWRLQGGAIAGQPAAASKESRKTEGRSRRTARREAGSFPFQVAELQRADCRGLHPAQ